MNCVQRSMVFVAFMINALVTFAQGNIKSSSYLSMDIYTFCPNYYYIFSQKNVKNYGIGASINNNYRSFKFSIGTNFYTQYSRVDYDATNPVEKTESIINYFNVPLLAKINLNNNPQNNNFLLIIGTTINKPFGYRSTSYYRNSHLSQQHIKPEKYMAGISLTSGVEFNKSLGKINVLINLFVNYKIVVDRLEFPSLNPHPGNLVSEGDKLQFGISLGIEYPFKKMAE